MTCFWEGCGRRALLLIVALLTPMATAQAGYEDLADEVQRRQESVDSLRQAVTEATAALATQRQQARVPVVDSSWQPDWAPSDAGWDDYNFNTTEQEPPVALYSALAFVATVSITLLVILGLEQIDNRIKGPIDVERFLGVRALAALPQLEEEAALEQMRPEEAEAERVRLAAFHESFRSIRGQILMAPGEQKLRAISVISARGDEGRTTVAMNLAESIAQAGEHVVVVDANLRAPTVHAMYGVDNELGLTSVLRGEATVEQVLRDTDVPGLRIMPAGPIAEDPAMLLSSPALETAMGELRDRYGWVIVDTAPGLAYVDALLAAGETDSALLVVAAGEIARGAHDRFLSDVEGLGVSVFGAVVNKVLPQHADALYAFQREVSGGGNGSGGNGQKPSE
ncbi:MAG: polysaccharide biosynthesis tyrosine autokinase [Armatimonadia bacterium]|nr:polysaccharide biosynthesis tyrosine autokinase [Armatimonadia bacterium]